MGKMRNAYNILLGKPEWKRPLGRPRCRCDDNVRIGVREVGCKGVEWVLGSCEHGNESLGSIKVGDFFD
jgi:hypothetical protein